MHVYANDIILLPVSAFGLERLIFILSNSGNLSEDNIQPDTPFQGVIMLVYKLKTNWDQMLLNFMRKENREKFFGIRNNVKIEQ